MSQYRPKVDNELTMIGLRVDKDGALMCSITSSGLFDSIKGIVSRLARPHDSTYRIKTGDRCPLPELDTRATIETGRSTDDNE